MKILLLTLVLLLTGCTLIDRPYLVKYENTRCKNTIITSDADMILLEMSAKYMGELFYRVSKNTLESYEGHLSHNRVRFEVDGAFIYEHNIEDNSYEYTKSLRELKLYKKGSKFKLIHRYKKLNRGLFAGASPGSFLVQSLEDNQFMWLSISDLNTKICEIDTKNFPENYRQYFFKDSNSTKVLTESVFGISGPTHFTQADDVYKITKQYIKEHVDTIKKEKKRQEQVKKQKTEESQKKLYTNLYTKITTGKYANIKRYQKLGLDINNRFNNGQTALILALIHNNKSAATSLLRNGADLSIKDDFGKNAFDYVGKNTGLYPLMRVLNTKNKTKNLQRNSYLAVYSYEKKNDTVSVDYDEGQKGTWSPLILAIKINDNKKVKKLIDEKLYLEDKTSNGSTPIFAAVKFKNNKALDFLLEAGTNVNIQNNFGVTPLFNAVVLNNTYAISELLKHNANMNQMENHNIYTPFLQAIAGNNIKIVKQFIAKGVDVNFQQNKSETALTHASKNCKKEELFKLLLANGADPDLEDLFAKTTRTGLKRYCKDDVKYKNFIKIIENYD